MQLLTLVSPVQEDVDAWPEHMKWIRKPLELEKDGKGGTSCLRSSKYWDTCGAASRLKFEVRQPTQLPLASTGFLFIPALGMTMYIEHPSGRLLSADYLCNRYMYVEVR